MLLRAYSKPYCLLVLIAPSQERVGVCASFVGTRFAQLIENTQYGDKVVAVSTLCHQVTCGTFCRLDSPNLILTARIVLTLARYGVCECECEM